MVHQPGKLPDAAAPDDLRAVRSRLSAFEQAAQRWKILEPLHQVVVIAAERRQVVERQHQPYREAGAVGVDERCHVEANGPPVDDAVA